MRSHGRVRPWALSLLLAPVIGCGAGAVAPPHALQRPAADPTDMPSPVPEWERGATRQRSLLEIATDLDRAGEVKTLIEHLDAGLASEGVEPAVVTQALALRAQARLMLRRDGAEADARAVLEQSNGGDEEPLRLALARAHLVLAALATGLIVDLDSPPYTEPLTPAGMAQHLRGPFQMWLERLEGMRAEAQAHLDSASQLLGSLQTTTDATLRVEAARRYFAWQLARALRDVRRAPIPEALEAIDALYDLYADALDQWSEPFGRTMQQRLEECSALEREGPYIDGHTRACSAALSRQPDAPVASELVGPPTEAAEPQQNPIAEPPRR